jgi:hypothetical protein
MQEIRWNFKGEEGDIKSTDRYVSDMRQLGIGSRFDLEGYNGMAYGLQYQLDDFDWSTHGDIYKLSKESSDKRLEGAITNVSDQYADWDSDSQRGKYFYLFIDQQPSDRTPGAVYINGWWYANEPGNYKVKMSLETVDGWADGAMLIGAVFGYRNGYLDGERKDYIVHGVGEEREKNKIYEYEDTFTVDKNHRHVVMSFSVWQPGGYGYNAVSYARVHNVTVEKI